MLLFLIWNIFLNLVLFAEVVVSVTKNNDVKK